MIIKNAKCGIKYIDFECCAHKIKFKYRHDNNNCETCVIKYKNCES